MKTITRILLIAMTLLGAGCTAHSEIPENDSWKMIGQTPHLMAEGDAVVLNGLIYVTGGFNNQDIDIFDPATGSWTTGANMPEVRHHLQTVAYDGKIYVLGGTNEQAVNLIYPPANNVWVYDPAADQWEERGPMPEGRVAGDAVVVGEYIYVVGGVGLSKAVLRYDPVTDSWDKLAESGVSRDHVTAAVLDNKIYLTGGRWGMDITMASVETYDTETDTWSQGVPMNEPRSATANFTYDGKIYVTGGEVLNVEKPYAIDTVTVFDPVNGKWTYADDMPVTLHGHQVMIIGDHVYIVGGLTTTPDTRFNEGVYLMVLAP